MILQKKATDVLPTMKEKKEDKHLEGLQVALILTFTFRKWTMCDNLKKIILLFIITVSLFSFTDVYGVTIGEVISPKVDRELQNESNKISGKAVVLVYSNTSWSGTVSGGDLG